MSLTFESVEFNTVDETVYALPEAVKALVEPKPSTHRRMRTKPTNTHVAQNAADRSLAYFG